MLEPSIQQHFIDSADLKYQAAQALGQPIAAAVQALLACVTNGAKVLACGVGVSAAEAQQFAAYCVRGFERDRPGLAALALACDPADGESPFAPQVRALGQAGDVLLAITTRPDDAALLPVIEAAHERDMSVIVLCGRQAAPVAAVLRETDVLVGVPHERAARVREVHVLVVHCLCDGVDTQLLGEQEIPL